MALFTSLHALRLMRQATPAPAKIENPVMTEVDRVPSVHTGGSCLIKNGRVVTVTGPVYDRADVLIVNGKIIAVGPNLAAPAGTIVIDAAGKFVTPGLVDAHSHRGEEDTNEYSASAVAEVRIADVLNADQRGLWDDLASGITSALVLHGSSNAIGGQSVVIKNRYRGRSQDLPFKGAPRMVKFALGENVSEKLSSNGTRYPTSRAGVESVYRRAFTDARAYMQAWDDFEKGVTKLPPRKDVRLDALSDILRKKIWVECHSYRQDEILMMLRLSQVFGFKIGAMQHALEAYKVAPELAKAGIPASCFSDAWNYKIEVMDAIPMGVAILTRGGVVASVNTDTFSGVAPLNIDAAKQMRYGVSEAEAFKLVTLNPARQLGVDQFVGSLEVGKDGDVAIWDGHPLSVYSKCSMTLIDGEVVFQRRDAFYIDSVSKTSNSVSPSLLSSDLATPLPESRTYALVGGTLHPVSKAVITDGVLLIRDGRIERVGDASTPVPNGYVRVDVRGKDVYPGFIDAGSDVGLNENGSVRSMQDSTENGPFQPDLRFLTSVNPESIKIPIARCGGVTSAYVRPTGKGLVMGLGSVVNMAGSTPEQMTVGGSRGLCVQYPEGPNGEFRAFLSAKELEEREKAVGTNREALTEFFNQAKRYSGAREAGLVPVDARFEAMRPYLRGELPVMVAVNDSKAIREALAWAKPLGLKIVIWGGIDAWKVADELVAQNVPVIYQAPTTSNPGTNGPGGTYDPYDTRLAAPAVMARKGVRFCLQSGDSSTSMNLPWSAGMTVAYGLSHDRAVRSLTLDAATILGVDKDLGSLDEGKLANIVVYEGDPLEITTQLSMEFIAGRPQRLSSHFTELYRKYERRIQK